MNEWIIWYRYVDMIDIVSQYDIYNTHWTNPVYFLHSYLKCDFFYSENEMK